MKRAEVLIVEDLKGERKIDEKKMNEILEKIKEADQIVISKVTLPIESEDDDLVGIHVIVREVAET